MSGSYQDAIERKSSKPRDQAARGHLSYGWDAENPRFGEVQKNGPISCQVRQERERSAKADRGGLHGASLQRRGIHLTARSTTENLGGLRKSR